MLEKGSFLTLGCGFEFHYHLIGNGPCVLFLHGSGTGASGMTNFRGNFQSFVDNGFSVLIPDLPGYGFSSKPEDEIYSLDYFNSKLSSLLEALNIQKVSIVGNSLGGALALGMAINTPELVEKLILMAPGGLEDQEEYSKMPGIQKLLGDFLGGPMTPEKVKGLLKLFPYNSEIVTQQMIDDRLEVLPLMNQQVLASMQIPNLTKHLQEVRVPILSIWGLSDQFIPIRGSETLEKCCNDVRTISFKECGHWVMIEKADEFNNYCISFLKNS